MFWSLPTTVRLRWTTAEHGGTATPEELASLGPVAPVRLAEFVTTRHLARVALLDAGGPPASLPVGPDRAPVWPMGWVGSLTHCHGLRAAAVARRTEHAALGIDAESAVPLPAEVHAEVLTPTERRRCADLGALGATAVFSAKECFYKVWAPLTGRWLDFADVEVAGVRPADTGRATLALRARVPAPPALETLEVGVSVRSAWVLAAASVPASERARTGSLSPARPRPA